MSSVTVAELLLINVIFGAVELVFLLRAAFLLCGLSFFNPIGQLLAKLTNPVLVPLRRILPVIRRVDTGALLVAWLAMWAELCLGLTALGQSFQPLAILGVAAVRLLDFAVLVLLVIIIIRAILSWFGGSAHGHPATPVLFGLSEPVLAPMRRLIPPVSGFDFSPLVVILGLQLTRILLLSSLEGALAAPLEPTTRLALARL